MDTIVRDQNITVILAAHRLSTIAQAERVIVLENGLVSEEGPYSVLVSSCKTSLGLAPGPGIEADVYSLDAKEAVSGA